MSRPSALEEERRQRAEKRLRRHDVQAAAARADIHNPYRHTTTTSIQEDPMTAHITLTGTVFTTTRSGQDALQLKRSQAGAPRLTFDVADQHRRQDQAGNWGPDERKGHKGTSRYRVTVFNGAEEIAKQMAAAAAGTGRCRVIVSGSVSVDTWERQDGTLGTTVSVVADRGGVGIVPSGQGGAGRQAQSSQSPAAGQDPWGGDVYPSEAPF